MQVTPPMTEPSISQFFKVMCVDPFVRFQLYHEVGHVGINSLFGNNPKKIHRDHRVFFLEFLQVVVQSEKNPAQNARTLSGFQFLGIMKHLGENNFSACVFGVAGGFKHKQMHEMSLKWKCRWRDFFREKMRL